MDKSRGLFVALLLFLSLPLLAFSSLPNGGGAPTSSPRAALSEWHGYRLQDAGPLQFDALLNLTAPTSQVTSCEWVLEQGIALAACGVCWPSFDGHPMFGYFNTKVTIGSNSIPTSGFCQKGACDKPAGGNCTEQSPCGWDTLSMDFGSGSYEVTVGSTVIGIFTGPSTISLGPTTPLPPHGTPATPLSCGSQIEVFFANQDNKETGTLVIGCANCTAN